MSTTVKHLGFIPKNRGEYVSGERYYKDNIAQYHGSSYIANPTASVNDGNAGTQQEPLYYLTRVPFDDGSLSAGWDVFASGNNVFSTGERVTEVGIDDEPTAESDNLVKSGGVADVIGIPAQPFERIRHEVSQTTASATGSRFSLLFNVNPGYIVRVQSDWESGVFAAIWSDRENALMGAGENRLEGEGSYVKTEISYTTSVSGVLRIGTKKNDNSAITDQDIAEFLDGLSFKIVKADSINERMPIGIPFTTILLRKGDYFNANNTTYKVEIPPFTCLIDGESVQFQQSQEVDYLWHTDMSDYSEWHALVISDDKQRVEMVTWLDIVNKKHILAFIARGIDGYLDHNAPAVIFTGCNSNADEPSIWRIDGENLSLILKSTALRIKNNYALQTDIVQNTADYDGVYMVSVANQELITNIQGYRANMDRIRVLYYVKSQSRFSCSMSLGGGYFAAVYNNYNNAIISSAVYNLLQNLSNGTYTTDSLNNAEIVETGVLAVSLKKSDGSVFTQQEYNDYLAALNVRIEQKGLQSVEDSINKLELERVYMSSLLQRGYTYAGVSATNNPKRVSSACVCALPYKGCTLRFKMPRGYWAGIRSGRLATNLLTNDFWFKDGDTLTLNPEYLYYRFSFAKTATDVLIFDDSVEQLDISVNEVQKLIVSGKIGIYYDKPLDVLRCNVDTEKYVKATMRVITGDLYEDNTINNMPIFAHTSDVHGDSVRFYRFVRYAKHLGVDAALVTGDMVGYTGNNGMDYIHDALEENNLKGFICLGNHDTWGDNYSLESMYNNVMKRNIDDNEAVVDSQVTYPTYYYKDLTQKKIRIIALNEYDGGSGDLSTRSYYSQRQINWLCSTLLSTPSDYGVIILFHSPETAITKVNGKDKFWQSSIPYADYQSQSMSTTPIANIVDAFISGGSLSTTFTEHNYVTGEDDTININADFTNKNSGVEFLFYACGHEHSDRIGYAPNVTNIQLVIDICCGVALSNPIDYPYLAGISDMPRGGIGAVQDSFNIYTVDRDGGCIRIARVGSNMDSYCNIRDFMVIPYK